MISSEMLGQRIADARRRLGWTQADLGSRLGLTRQTVLAMEKGSRRPGNAELVRIAELLGVALGELVSERVARAQASPRFRGAARGGLSDEAVRRATADLERLGAAYVELERLAGVRRFRGPLESLETYRVSESAGPRPDPVLAGQDAALVVRSLLGLADGPATNLDELLERHAGLRVFHLSLPEGMAALFLWGEELGPCVGLHAQHPHERRRWSLAHELGHFLRDRETGDVLPTGRALRYDDSEVFAESLAKALLLPAGGVTRYFGEIRRENGERFTPGGILRMAATYEVSFQAMTLRLEDLGLLPGGTYDRVSRGKTFRLDDARRELGLAPEPRPGSRFPSRYVALAMEAFARDAVTEGELADYLDLDRVAARGAYLEYRARAANEDEDYDVDLAANVLASPARGRS